MEWPLLGMLLLLLAPSSMPMQKEGEICRAWMHARELTPGPFQCPEELDSEDAAFCCGTCTSPSCCSSKEDRLDQEKCPESEQPKGHVGPHVEPMPYIKQFLLYFFGTIIATVTSFGCFFCYLSHSTAEPEEVNPEIEMVPLVLPAEDPGDASSEQDGTPDGGSLERHEDESAILSAPLLGDELGCGSTPGPVLDAEDSAGRLPCWDGVGTGQGQPGVGVADSEEAGPSTGGGSLVQVGSGAEGEDFGHLGLGLDEEDVDLKVPEIQGNNAGQAGPGAEWGSSDQMGSGLDGEVSEQSVPGLEGDKLDQMGSDMDGGDPDQTMPGLEGEDSDQVVPHMALEATEQTVSGPGSGGLDQMEPRMDGANLDLTEPGMLRESAGQLRASTEKPDLMQPGLRVGEEDSEM